MRDPRFNKFLKDKLEHYSFAERLMDFCLERTSKPDLEDFTKKSQFPITSPDSFFSTCQVRFLDTYARCWMSKRAATKMDDALSLLYSIFGENAEITPQKDDKAVGLMIRDEETCNLLINWLSGNATETEGFLSALDLFKLVTRENILTAISDFENGIDHNFGPSTQYDLIHEEKEFPPKAILGIACKYVEGGRLLKAEEFSGGEESACFKTLRREGFTIKPKQNNQIEEGVLYKVPTIIVMLKELWRTNRPKSDNKFKIIENLNAYKDEEAYFKPYGPAWAASPWNEKTWVKEDGKYLLSYNQGQKFWLYSPGEQARLWRDCWERKEAVLLWDTISDLRYFSTKEEIKDAFFQNDPENKNPSNDALALWEFANEMNPGDVIIAKQGRSKYLGYGIVAGEYDYNDQAKEGFHKRAVEWKKHGEWEDPLGTFAVKTLTDITNLETSSPDYERYVDRLIDLIGIEIDGHTKTLKKKPNTMINSSFSQDFHSACETAGLKYRPKLLRRFTSSLLAKRFLILTGLSGSGKTKLAQAFAEWIGCKSTPSDPFFPGAGIESSQKTYRVAKSDSLAVEFWNDENEEQSTKVTLGREMIAEWANCILENNLPKETSPRSIREMVNEKSQFSPQLHSFETHLKAAAFALIESQKNAVSYKSTELIPVGADWTSNENILGYPDGLNPQIYNSTPILDLVLRATQNPQLPHFLILDEMNLSHVERYFADMLSAIESDEAIPLYEAIEEDSSTWRKTNTGKQIPPGVKLPNNLFIIGTVNVDETTYMFSPKVLDRANVIEFRVESNDLQNYLQDGAQKPVLSKLESLGTPYAEHFVAAQNSSITNSSQLSLAVNQFFKIFSKHESEFGFRVANEAARLISFQKLLGSDSFNENFDSVIVQKFLPKLHGSRSQLEELLQELITATSGSEVAEWEEELLTKDDPTYPLSYNKLCRMYKKLQRDQFVSFAEA